jgi:Cu+-exporting ATPase
VDAAVIGGTLNQSGALVIRAELGRDTMLARIVQMVAEAQRSRAPIQRLADQVAGWFVPAVLGVAVLAFVAWGVWGPEPRLAHGLIAAVAVLIIACPCALGLATPMSIMVGVGRGAGLGVLIKNAEALERLEKVETLIVDKTGTLTEGSRRSPGSLPRKASRRRRPGGGGRARLGHPLALAVVAAATGRGISIPAVSDFDAPTGRGAIGTVDNRRVTLGNARIMRESGIDLAAMEAAADELRRDGATAIFVGFDARRGRARNR